MSEFNKTALKGVIEDLFKELILNSPLNRPYQKCAVAPLDLSGIKIAEYKMQHGSPTSNTIDRIVARCVVTPNLVLRVTWEQLYFGYIGQTHKKALSGEYQFIIALETTIKNKRLGAFNSIKSDFSMWIGDTYKAVDGSVTELVQHLTSHSTYITIEREIHTCELKAVEMAKIIAPFA